MPMYLVAHKWSEEESLDALREASRFFTSFLESLPKEIEFLASYNCELGAYTLWRAADREMLDEIFREFPIFSKRAEITEIVQSYPPTVEYTVRMWKMIIGLSERR